MLSALRFGKGQKRRLREDYIKVRCPAARPAGVRADDGSWNETQLKMVVKHPVAVPGLDRGLNASEILVQLDQVLNIPPCQMRE